MSSVRIRRVVTTRDGGLSAGPYASFNLGDRVGDAPEAVGANRQRLAAGVGLAPDRLAWMEQVHGRGVAVLDQPPAEPLPVTDALVTATVNIALVVLVADCVPVLLGDASAGVIAAVHAGRVGARAGVLPAALDAMWQVGATPANTDALLGPSACGRCYEVPDAMRADVGAALPGSACRTRRGSPGLDLRAGLAEQLARASVGRLDIDPRCTIEDPSLFSYRREGTTGRLAALIWMRPDPAGQGR